jgi:hypothetical protein
MVTKTVKVKITLNRVATAAWISILKHELLGPSSAVPTFLPTRTTQNKPGKPESAGNACSNFKWALTVFFVRLDI